MIMKISLRKSIQIKSVKHVPKNGMVVGYVATTCRWKKK